MHEFFPIREWDRIKGKGVLGSVNLDFVVTTLITKNEVDEELPYKDWLRRLEDRRPWWGLGLVRVEVEVRAKTSKRTFYPDGVRIWFLDGQDSVHAEADPDLLEVLDICDDEGEEDEEKNEDNIDAVDFAITRPDLFRD